MSRRHTKQDELATAPGQAPRDHRPSPRVAFQISLGVHALIVLMLFRMYSEYAAQPEPPLHIVTRGSAPRAAATPSFVAVPLATVEAPKITSHPAVPAETLPRQATSFLESVVMPVRPAIPISQRAAPPAELPMTDVALPAEEVLPLAATAPIVSVDVEDITLERTDTWQDLPIRMASRPIYGPRAHRPLGLAALPASRDESRPRRPADAFAHRHSGVRTPPANRSAVDRGLEFLARSQLDDGRWQFRSLRGTTDPIAASPCPRADAAATGLALLAFLGAGHDHFDGRYRLVVEDGLRYLIHTQMVHGEFFPEYGLATGQLDRFYSHGIATLALCEAFGMTGDEQLRQPAQLALDYLAGTHHRVPGGWRFLPGVDADASAVGWQLATLRSGQVAGLRVEPQTIDNIRQFLARSRDRNSAARTPVATAVGLAVELHLGDSPGVERTRPAAEQLLAHSPEVGPQPDPDESDAARADSPRRDSYYWYYGSEAMFYLGGEDWLAWSRQLYPQLIQSQVVDGPLAGSWDPNRTTDGLATASGGRLYMTAMNLLSLEIQNRHLPQ